MRDEKTSDGCDSFPEIERQRSARHWHTNVFMHASGLRCHTAPRQCQLHNYYIHPVSGKTQFKLKSNDKIEVPFGHCGRNFGVCSSCQQTDAHTDTFRIPRGIDDAHLLTF